MYIQNNVRTFVRTLKENKMAKIKSEVAEKVKKNKACISRLALAFNVGGRAIERAIERNVENGYLVSPVGLKVIRTHTGLTNKEILE